MCVGGGGRRRQWRAACACTTWPSVLALLGVLDYALGFAYEFHSASTRFLQPHAHHSTLFLVGAQEERLESLKRD